MAPGTLPTAPPRPLWQIPTFLCGVAALAAVLATRATCNDLPQMIGRDLDVARQYLSRPDGDADAAAAAAQRALDRGAAELDRAGEAYFLLGTARMRQGDRAAGESNRVHWEAARQAFAEAERQGVPAEDAGRLSYRLGKVGFHLGDDPRAVIERLTAGAEQAEDRAEAYDLLAQAHLRLPQPDYAKALEANSKLRELSLLRDDLLAAVKLRSGELKLKLGRAEEARKDLELIGPSAPPPVLSRARLLRAQSYQDEGKWAEAAALWQAALADTREPAADRPAALLQLGFCHRRLDRAEDAVRVWDECARTSMGAESTAAAVQLAELRVDARQFGEARELLTGAAGRIRTAAEWKNPYIGLERVCDVFEKTIRTCREAGQYEAALQLAGNYERFAAAGRAPMLRAEAATAWARKRKAEPAGSAENEQTVRDLFRQAGAAWTEAAATLSGQAQADAVWQAAGRYLEGQDATQALPTLERWLTLETRPERLGEGWFQLAEVHRRSKNNEAAEAAYLKCITFPTPFAYRARYQLALEHSRAKRLDRAVEILEQNLQSLRFEPDVDAREQSLFALGNVCYQRRDYRAVVRWLEEALGHFPANADATRAHFQLADSYRQLAARAKQDELNGESKNREFQEHLRKEHLRWLRKAADEFQELSTFLDKPESAGHLAAEERADVPFIAADCRFNLGQYKEALAIYEKLIAAHPNQLPGLNALGGAVRCHAALGDKDALRQRLDEIRRVLSGMDESVRQQWDDWLIVAAKPVTP